MAIKLLSLNHYSIAVIDLEKSLSFYQGVLGMTLSQDLISILMVPGWIVAEGSLCIL